ncbi:MAG: hypothetical protein PHD29_02680 [bacterium]|nr:hypothetical protein [bacterium]MDD5756724.1 hypothetical protein [bacterium]
MKKMSLLLCSFFLLTGLIKAQAADVGVHLNVNIGASPRVVIAEPPVFIAPPALGFYVAGGVTYDLFYSDSHYYLCRGNVWYYAASYDGPWIMIRYERLPLEIRRHKYTRIIAIRDEEYRRYTHNHSHYDGWYFHPSRHDQGRGQGKKRH